jgi:hypothetical protein
MAGRQAALGGISGQENQITVGSLLQKKSRIKRDARPRKCSGLECLKSRRRPWSIAISATGDRSVRFKSII